MPRFFFRHVPFHRAQIMGRGLRALKVRLAKARRVNRRAKRSLKALQFASAEIEKRNWWTGVENELMFLYNAVSDQWVNESLVELENDPLMRNAFERFNDQNLDGRDNINVEQAQPGGDGGSTGDRLE